MRTVRRLVLAVVVLVALVAAGTFVYINVIREDAPDELTLQADDTTGAATGGDATPGEVAGTWTAGAGSLVGYRVDEILFGQDAAAVGRTEEVTGTLVIDGTTVESVSMEADMATVASDQERRDNQFKGRIMDVEKYPTATFELTEPIDLADPGAETASVEAVGELTIHGVTEVVTIPIVAARNGDQLELVGAITFPMADFGITPPSIGGFVTVEDDATLEFKILLEQEAASP